MWPDRPYGSPPCNSQSAPLIPESNTWVAQGGIKRFAEKHGLGDKYGQSSDPMSIVYDMRLPTKATRDFTKLVLGILAGRALKKALVEERRRHRHYMPTAVAMEMMALAEGWGLSSSSEDEEGGDDGGEVRGDKCGEESREAEAENVSSAC